ncbi:thioesterase II family protein [Streptomyces mirabilis]|uniref:thioesterase II family protein n=1 Tax=Streptomyces mirabilis TaxID=68239 RepID=UPI002F91A7F6
MSTSREDRTARWLRPCRPPSNRSAARLVFLPPAGGTVRTLDALATRLPADIGVYAVQYPGRQDRYGEPFPQRIEEMVAPIVQALTAFIGEPLIVFGHSMGAYVAYETALALERRFGSVVHLLVVSGAVAPHRKGIGATHTLPDARLAAEVRRVNPDFADLLAQPDLVDLLLPMIRADYRLFEQYRKSEPVAVRAPLLVVSGRADPEIDGADLGEWAACADAGADVRLLPGGHFYLTEDAGPVAELMAERLSALGHRRRAG